MKLSDAIMLGRTVIQHIDANSYCGCAIGMGLAALGHTYILHSCGFKNPDESYEALQDAIKEWPWLVRPVFPRHHPAWYTNYYGVRGHDIISEGFNRVTAGKLSLEALVDWIRSVEPEPKIVDTDNRCEQPVLEECQEVAAVNHS